MIAVERFTKWMHEGFTKEAFKTIFEIKNENNTILDNAIKYLSEVGTHLETYLKSTERDRAGKESGFHQTLWLNIVTDMAMDIKLISEGYMYESLRSLRVTIDNFIMAIFSSISWSSTNLTIDDSTNPFIKNFLSPAYFELREVEIAEIYARGTEFKDGSGKFQKLIDVANSKARKIVSEVEESLSSTGSEKILSSTRLDRLSIDIAEVYVDILRNSTKKQIGDDHEIVKEPSSLRYVFRHDNAFTVRSCKAHRQEMIEQFKKSLKGSYDDEAISNMIYTAEEEAGLSCGFCDNPASNFILKVKPSFRFMIEVIEKRAPLELLEGLRHLSRYSEGEKANFERFIRSRVQRSARSFSKGETMKEPTQNEWYDDYYLPILVLAEQILFHFVEPGFQVK